MLLMKAELGLSDLFCSHSFASIYSYGNDRSIFQWILAYRGSYCWDLKYAQLGVPDLNIIIRFSSSLATWISVGILM